MCIIIVLFSLRISLSSDTDIRNIVDQWKRSDFLTESKGMCGQHRFKFFFYKMKINELYLQIQKYSTHEPLLDRKRDFFRIPM